MREEQQAAEKRTLRPFQREVLCILQDNKKSVILQAPTGAGKTEAALYPYVQCLAQDGDWLPPTCLYATPMRVLSNQFYEKYGTRIARLDDSKGTRLAEIYEKLKRDPVSLQTGEQPNDPQFEALITFCTIDQLLASFLAVPYGVNGGRQNLNVGAVIGSYLVLDEFHLYPLLNEGVDILGARTTTLAMLRLLKSVTRFVLMTATLSSALVDELAALLDAEVVRVESEDELRQIAGGRRRTFEVAPTAMTADAILAQHRRCSLVICNTVLRAQQYYWELKQRTAHTDIEVVLLHSRLTNEDRAQRATDIVRQLGPAPAAWPGEERYGWQNGRYYGKNMIVVATQVVEVGLDISVETLHSEIAPASSLIQRAGRCARFSGQEGRVIVYDLPEEDAQGRSVTTMPYSASLCTSTLAALRALPPGQAVGFPEERALIDAVHSEEDRKLLERYGRQDFINKRIFESFCTNQRSVVTTLIRDVLQVQILLHDDPNAAIKEEPWRWQSFALHPASLAARWQVLEQRAAELQLDFVGLKTVLISESEEREPDSRQKARYEWKPIPSSKNTGAMMRALMEPLMIVLHPQLATYHEELGFVLLDGRLEIASTGYMSAPPPSREGRPGEDDGLGRRSPTAIKMESYRQHINGLVRAYSYSPGGIRINMRYVTARLEHLLDFPAGAIDHAISLALACHDLGKLSEAWQRWAWEWERLLEREGQDCSPLPEQPFFFAKTDFRNTKEQRDLQRGMKVKRPNHACESVMLGFSMMAESLGVDGPEHRLAPLLYAVCAAIARHHTPQAHEYGDVTLARGAEQAVEEALELARLQASWRYNLALLEKGHLKPGKLDNLITTPQQGEREALETWLYFVIVRALRLADQRAGVRW